jgi:hypothetical protein
VAVDKSNSESMAALTAAAADVVQDKVTETVAKQALTDVAALPANEGNDSYGGRRHSLSADLFRR